jgi:hypothetical protein
MTSNAIWRRERVRWTSFDQVAELLATMDLEAIWNEATPAERRTLVEDLVDSVCIYPDRITVHGRSGRG